MAAIASLAHVCIKTTDLEKTLAFYCDALGMQKLFAFTRKGKVIGFYLKAGNETFIEVFEAEAVEKLDNKQALHHFCLQTEAIAELRQTLLESGYAPGAIKLGCDNSLQFWMDDPNGLRFEFHQYTPKSSQFTGQDVEVTW